MPPPPSGRPPGASAPLRALPAAPARTPGVGDPRPEPAVAASLASVRWNAFLGERATRRCVVAGQGGHAADVSVTTPSPPPRPSPTELNYSSSSVSIAPRRPSFRPTFAVSRLPDR